MKKFLSLCFVSLFSIALLGCENNSRSGYEEPATKKENQIPHDYVGLSLEQAQTLAKKNNVPFRVVEQDGEAFMVTADFIIGRINAVVKNNTVVSYTVEGDFVKTYSQDSWKYILNADCQSFFDGCNNCRRMKDGGAACTRKACQKYQKPECLD